MPETPPSQNPLANADSRVLELQQQVQELQQRILRFSVVEQNLIDLRAELDDERAQIGRIHNFCSRLFHAHDEVSFDAIVAESVVDVFEQQFGLFWRLPRQRDAVRGWHPSAAGLGSMDEAWLSWLIERVEALREVDGLLASADLAQQPQPLAGHLAVAFCRDQDQRPVAVIVTGVGNSKLPFHQLLGAERMTSLSMFAQKVSVLMMMRQFGARLAQQDLQVKLSAEQLALALEAGNVGTWDRDLSTGLARYSPILMGMLGYPEGQFDECRADWMALVHPEDRDCCLELENIHLRGETQFYENTFRLRHRQGHDLWVLARGKALRDGEGRPLHFFGTVVDVTRQKSIEEHLRQAEDLERNARRQAEAATRAKSAFVASMSHEIRTPMNGVLGMLQVLRGTNLDVNQSGLVATAEKSALALLDLIGDILDLSKVEAGKLEIHPEPFAWRLLLEEITDLMRVRAEAKDITLDVEVRQAPPPWLIGDALRLRQILTNLINNAIKFTDQGGVTLVLDCVSIAGQPETHQVKWRVEDTGIGISPSSMSRLFKPFSQLDDSSENYRGGTGLGLSISQSLARLMGGEIYASSELGRGSQFEVLLPLRRCEPPGSGDSGVAASSLQPQARFGGRLLVVDDSPVGRMVAKLLLEQMGFEVEVVDGGQQAVDAVQAGGFRLVFMDCQMPGVDGYEATRRIRSREQELGLVRQPIVALTANVQPSEIEACLHSGMDGYLSKPVTKQALVKTLHERLAPEVS